MCVCVCLSVVCDVYMYVCVSSCILTVVTRAKTYVEIFYFLSCDTSQNLLIAVEAPQKIHEDFQGTLKNF